MPLPCLSLFFSGYIIGTLTPETVEFLVEANTKRKDRRDVRRMRKAVQAQASYEERNGTPLRLPAPKDID